MKLYKIYTAKPYSMLVRKLSIYLMIILQLHLRLNMHHFKGKDLYLITNSSPTVKSRYASEHVLNEMREIIYYFRLAKEITKKLYSNIMNLINV